MFGLAYTTTTSTAPSSGSTDGFSVPPSETKSHSVDVGLLGNVGNSPMNFPRLGFDYVIGAGFTVGGNLSYATSHGFQDGSSNENTYSAFMFGPRIGKIFMADSGNGVWLRAGLTVIEQSSTSTLSNGSLGGTTDYTSSTGTTDMDLEAMYVWSPVDRFTFNSGLTLDIPLGGSTESTGGSTSPPADLTISSVGAMFGVSAYF
jgi:hypothetical protein